MKIVVVQKALRPSFKRPNQSRWVLYAGNGKPLCNSGETYTNADDCLSALESALGEVIPPEDEMYNEVAEKLRRRVRGHKPCRIVGTIHHTDGSEVLVYDEVTL